MTEDKDGCSAHVSNPKQYTSVHREHVQRVATVTNTNPDYLCTKESMTTTFKVVHDLDPHASLFQWTIVSNIPGGLLREVIGNMKKNDSKLENPPSSEEISKLTKTSNTFKGVLAAYRVVKRNQP